MAPLALVPSWRGNSSYRVNTLGPLCLWQCFVVIDKHLIFTFFVVIDKYLIFTFFVVIDKYVLLVLSMEILLLPHRERKNLDGREIIFKKTFFLTWRLCVPILLFPMLWMMSTISIVAPNKGCFMKEAFLRLLLWGGPTHSVLPIPNKMKINPISLPPPYFPPAYLHKCLFLRNH